MSLGSLQSVITEPLRVPIYPDLSVFLTWYCVTVLRVIISTFIYFSNPSKLISIILTKCKLTLEKGMQIPDLLLLFLYSATFIWSMPISVQIQQEKNLNSRKTCEICSKLTITTPRGNYWNCSGIFIVN